MFASDLLKFVISRGDIAPGAPRADSLVKIHVLILSGKVVTHRSDVSVAEAV
jgi:hypothetical protein